MKPPPMEPRVCDMLRDLIRRFGHGLAENPARCQAMLRDLCPAQKREINVLITALWETVVGAIYELDCVSI